MKLAIICKSLLLEKALKLFLKPYIAPLKQCDFLVCDHEMDVDIPQFRLKTVDSELAFPFSKSALLISLDKFYKTLKESTSKLEHAKISTKNSDFATLEEKLNKICKQYNAQIIQTIKEHYGQ